MRPKTVNGAAKVCAAVVEVQPQRRVGLGAGRRHVRELAAAEARGRCRARGRCPATRSCERLHRHGDLDVHLAEAEAAEHVLRLAGAAPVGRGRVLGEAEHVGQARGHVAQLHARRLAPPLVDRRAALRRLGRFDLHRGRDLLPALRRVREAEQPVGGDAARLGDAAQRLGARQAVDAGVEELAERRAVDAGVAQEAGDAAALLAEQAPAGARGRRRRCARLSMRSFPACREFATYLRVFARYCRISPEIHVIARWLGSAHRLAQTPAEQRKMSRDYPVAGTRGARVEWPTLVLLVAHLCRPGRRSPPSPPTSALWLAVPLLAVILAQHSSLQHEVIHGHPTPATSG